MVGSLRRPSAGARDRARSAGRPLLVAIALCLAGSTGAGCSSDSGSRRTKTSSKGATAYQRTAEANYERGMAELRDDNWTEAIKYFNIVRNGSPFSRFAPLSELRIADALFGQEKYAAAIDAYKLFIKFHPTHPKTVDGYAAYRVAEGYVKQIPKDWFLVPPSHEKDQSATREATRELQAFITKYKNSKYLDKAKKLYRDSIRKLIAHELYVARFYLDRDKPRATILRLEGVLKRFPNAGIDAEVMLLLGKTYLKLDKHSKAKATFAKLVEKYPKDANAAKARLFLRYLEKR